MFPFWLFEGDGDAWLWPNLEYKRSRFQRLASTLFNSALWIVASAALVIALYSLAFVILYPIIELLR